MRVNHEVGVLASLRPVVLCLSGHDPSGGAGIQADIEVLTSHKCHAASVITALTEQDTHNVKKIIPQGVEDFTAQVHTLLADLPVKVIKIGLIGDYRLALAIHAILQENPKILVVLDPILAAGGGAVLADRKLCDAITQLLLPQTFIATPNSVEARQLARQDDLRTAGDVLMGYGCRNVLITGAHEDTQVVRNQFFQKEQSVQTFTWDRLPGHYHGSGCTLTSCIAALVAHGLDVFDAVHEAQEYTWHALNSAYRTGHGQFNPNRFFWVDNDSKI